MLWLSLHLPQLPLETFTRGMAETGPAWVTHGSAQRAQVWVANQAAQQLGVMHGMSAAAAQALVSNGRVFQRDLHKEHAALAGLAAWAGQFTSTVSLETDGLLLEVSGSLKLFGGVEKLADKVRKGVKALGYHAVLAGAPTPLGANLLAHAGEAEIITDHAQWAARLACLPVALLDYQGQHCDLLDALGVGVIGEYLALPRAGLKRRFGADLLDRLDRALGMTPDPRENYTPPARFAARIELPAEVSESSALVFAARRLIVELEGFLRGRGAGVQQFLLELRHADHPVTRVSVGLASPGRDSQRLINLLRERLERLTLEQAVREIALLVEHTCPYQPRSLDLFPDTLEASEAEAPFIERLRARLGDDVVHGVSCAADHRPEAATQRSAPGVAHATRYAASRPMWLLPQPRPLTTRGGVPQLGVPLILRQGPERIESGWWDGRAVARDYYVAETVDGPCYWVYREPAGSWYLHGIFS
jgi:protein ImuB